jgi:hypothetical protein
VNPSKNSSPDNLEAISSKDSFTLSKEQYQGILALLQQSGQTSHSVNHVHNNFNNPAGNFSASPAWILDSGATDHICPTKYPFLSLSAISLITIKLPNHKSVVAHFSGTIKHGYLLLHNALYVPNFDVHLISIPKLIYSLDCLVVFAKPVCLIVQKLPLKMIGAARRLN